MDEAARHIAAIAESAAAGRLPPESAIRWLADGVLRLVERRARSLDEALELDSTGRGKERRVVIYLREIRDFHLAAAFQLLDGESDHERLQLLDGEIRNLLALMEELPPGGDLPFPTMLQRHLLLALKYGGNRLPSSFRGLTESVYNGLLSGRH